VHMYEQASSVSEVGAGVLQTSPGGGTAGCASVRECTLRRG